MKTRRQRWGWRLAGGLLVVSLSAALWAGTAAAEPRACAGAGGSRGPCAQAGAQHGYGMRGHGMMRHGMMGHGMMGQGMMGQGMMGQGMMGHGMMGPASAESTAAAAAAAAAATPTTRPNSQPAGEQAREPASAPAGEQGSDLAGFAALLATADAERGGQLVAANGCRGCHALDDRLMVGPTWHDLAETAATRVPGQTAAGYLLTSIVRPNDYVVPGYQPNVMVQSYGEYLSERDLADIVKYLLARPS